MNSLFTRAVAGTFQVRYIGFCGTESEVTVFVIYLNRFKHLARVSVVFSCDRMCYRFDDALKSWLLWGRALRALEEKNETDVFVVQVKDLGDMCAVEYHLVTLRGKIPRMPLFLPMRRSQVTGAVNDPSDVETIEKHEYYSLARQFPTGTSKPYLLPYLPTCLSLRISGKAYARQMALRIVDGVSWLSDRFVRNGSTDDLDPIRWAP